MRTCRTCGETKPLTEFYRHAKSEGGRLRHCRQCKRTEKNALYASSPAYAERARERSRRFHAENRLRVRDATLRRNYGISEEDYQEMLAGQGGACGACGFRGQRGRGGLHVDHDHTTGKVRGLLCSNCNTALGLCRDSPWQLVDYLTRHTGCK